MNYLMDPAHASLDGWEIMLLRTAQKISLTEPQYELISGRYETLQTTLSAGNDPLLQGAHILVQGSVRLKTALKPAPEASDELATIDADAVVWLPNAGNADAASVLQAIHRRFRDGTRVETPIKPLRRGIRIIYADEDPGFHIDVTPARCAPGNGNVNGEGMLQVPDRELGWKPSSPVPYSQWLEVTAAQEIQLVKMTALAKREAEYAEASQEPIPDYGEYIDPNPLRATIKLLKRHRDNWAIRTGKVSVRPISAVITTLAAKAYEQIAVESRARPLRPVEAIMQIVERMRTFVIHDGSQFAVPNPKDNGENFAEKWNRPNGEGAAYIAAFSEWHESAVAASRLGLVDFSSARAFAEAMDESFGVGNAFVEATVRELPGNWNLPGRAPGITGNSVRLGALIGGGAASAKSQASIRPVDRLG